MSSLIDKDVDDDEGAVAAPVAFLRNDGLIGIIVPLDGDDGDIELALTTQEALALGVTLAAALHASKLE